MIDILETVIGDIIMAINWGLFTAFFVSWPKYTKTKKAWAKIKTEYPFFLHPWYKRIFLIGLKGKMPTSIIIFTFITNIGMLLLIPVSIWNIIEQSMISSNVWCVVMGIAFCGNIARRVIAFFLPYDYIKL